MHLRLDAASAVVSAPSSPQSAAEILRGPQGLVARHGTSGDGLPRLRVLAGRDDGGSAALGDSIVALARVIGTIGGDAADLLVRRDLVEQVG